MRVWRRLELTLPARQPITMCYHSAARFCGARDLGLLSLQRVFRSEGGRAPPIMAVAHPPSLGRRVHAPFAPEEAAREKTEICGSHCV